MAHSIAADRSSDSNAVAVVVGGSRGIGLAMVQALVSRGWKGKIVATCRDVEQAGALSALWQFMPDRFSVLSMDVCDEASIEEAVDEVKEWTGDSRVDLLVQCAGILHEGDNMPETSLARVNADFFRRNLEVRHHHDQALRTNRFSVAFESNILNLCSDHVAGKLDGPCTCRQAFLSIDDNQAQERARSKRPSGSVCACWIYKRQWPRGMALLSVIESRSEPSHAHHEYRTWAPWDYLRLTAPRDR